MPHLPKTAAALTISDIRHLFETSPDANVVRDCVLAIGTGAGGVFESEVKTYQSDKALERLAVVFNAAHVTSLVASHRDFRITSVVFARPYYIDGRFVHCGYNVCSADGWTNVMPGACWFMTIASAMHGVDCLIEAGGSPRPPHERDDGVGPRFWKLMQPHGEE